MCVIMINMLISCCLYAIFLLSGELGLGLGYGEYGQRRREKGRFILRAIYSFIYM